MTADHGGKDIPERERAAGLTTAARVDPNLQARIVGARIANQLGLASFGLSGEAFGDIYVDRSLSPADRRRVLDAAVAVYRAHPQVEAVFTAQELAPTPVPTGDPVP